MQTYEVGPVTLILERNNTFTTVTMGFEFALDFDTIVPESQEEADDYHNSVARVIKFLQGINNAFIVETDHPETELFVTQRINNISIEVPEGCNKIPLIGLILFKKVKALLGDYPVEGFSLSFCMNESNTDKLKTTLDYSDDLIEGSKLQMVLQHYEEEWSKEMVSEHEELEKEHVENVDDHPTVPWWNRNDGQVRDFINMDIDSFQDFQNEELAIRILTVDLEDEYSDSPDDSEPSEPTNNGDYFKF